MSNKIVLGTKTAIKGCVFNFKPKWLAKSDEEYKKLSRKRDYPVVVGPKPILRTRSRHNAIMRSKPIEEVIRLATEKEMAALLKKYPDLEGRFLMTEADRKKLEKEQEDGKKLLAEYKKEFGEEEEEEETAPNGQTTTSTSTTAPTGGATGNT